MGRLIESSTAGDLTLNGGFHPWVHFQVGMILDHVVLDAAPSGRQILA
jgi:hypothetical protein